MQRELHPEPGGDDAPPTDFVQPRSALHILGVLILFHRLVDLDFLEQGEHRLPEQREPLVLRHFPRLRELLLHLSAADRTRKEERHNAKETKPKITICC